MYSHHNAKLMNCKQNVNYCTVHDMEGYSVRAHLLVNKVLFRLLDLIILNIELQRKY